MGVGDGRDARGIPGQGTVHARKTDLAPSLRERVRVCIESVRFERAITTLIVVNAITLGLETSPPVVARFGDWLHVIDRTALGVFAVELCCASSSTAVASSMIRGACSIAALSGSR